ncbi:MAG: hypothetical protein ACREEB_06050 [Caulobacteraceae bacterium]
MKRLALTVFIFAAGAAPALAASSPFDGTWKLDVGRSKFTGDTFTYAKTPNGFTYSNGATITYHFTVDGKDYPTTIPGRTTAWTKARDGGWDIVNKANGKVVSRTHRVLSPDGKTLTSSYTDYMPDGTTEHEHDVYTRVTGSTGLAGEWKDTKVQAASDTMRISSPSAARYEISYPSDRETIAGATDGAPAAIKGPTVPPGAMASVKAEGPRKWTRRVSLHGKTYGEGSLTVSADGKTLTVTRWVPGKQAEASVEVYIRQ